MKHARPILSYLASFLLALAFGVIIWLTATQEQDPARSQFIQLDVVFAGQPENSILVRPQTQDVQVRIEGRESVISQISPGDFNAFIDLSQVPFGQPVSVPVEISSTAAEVEWSAPIPEIVDVLLEQEVSREIPVELDIRGDVARGHVQGEPLIDPPFVTIIGPETSVEQLDFALATVFLNDARETTVGDHRPIFYDQRGRVASIGNLDLSTEQVQVTIPVVESAGFADKLISVDWVGDPAPGYRLLSVSVEPPSVLVQGLPARVNALTRLRTEPVDITGLTQSFSQQATLDLPDGISLDQDQEIFVSIEIEPILTTDIRERDVEILGLTANMEAVTAPERVRVVLFGPLAALDTLVDDDVRVSVDLFGLESGTHSLQPEVDLPERGIEVRSIQPGSVSVVVTRTITNANELSLTWPISETSMKLFRENIRDDSIGNDAGTKASVAFTIPIQNPANGLKLIADWIVNLPKRVFLL
ncbi:MAG: CdaR family protein [Candidatus Promineifilaceae bacterium]|nr:CdaR family protein [Candidatus Promineifilaceae bacterium]